MKNRKKGFTLVELLVVIAILAILATVSVVGYTAFITRANDSVAMQELTQVRDYMIAMDHEDDKYALKSSGLEFALTADTEDDAAAKYTFGDIIGTGKDLDLNPDEFTLSGTVVTYQKANNQGKATWDTVTGDIG